MYWNLHIGILILIAEKKIEDEIGQLGIWLREFVLSSDKSENWQDLALGKVGQTCR